MTAACSLSSITAAAGSVVAAILLWLYPSSAVTDVLIGGACLAALFHWRKTGGLWLSPAGLAAILVAAYPVVQLLWAAHPAAAAGDLARDLRLPAGAFALSFFVTGGRRIDRALLVSALVLLPVFAADLIRLHRALGPDFPALARYYKPQFMNHPNVSSMLAAAACLICLTGAWTRRSCRPAAVGLALGALLALAYLGVMASRGPQAAFAAAAGSAVLLLPRTWKGRLAGLVLAALAAGLIGTHLKSINARFTSPDLLSGRPAVWSHTASLIRQRPWFGYGYGKETFQETYRTTNPPPSPHIYPHPHQYALFVLFQGGRAWLILHAALWLLLAIRMGKALAKAVDETARLRLVLLALMIIQWQIYGLGDYPDNRLQEVFVALIPLALAASAGKADQDVSVLTRTSG
jgi:O-antigen ligase